jgi:hypothetical protein
MVASMTTQAEPCPTKVIRQLTRAWGRFRARRYRLLGTPHVNAVIFPGGSD